MELITCQHKWVNQCQLRYRIDPPSRYHFEDAHYPEPKCKNGTETVRLWYPDHIVHGALQTLNLKYPCMHGYRASAEKEILLLEYPEYADLYKEAHSFCQKFAGARGCSKAGKIGGKVVKQKGLGIFDPEVRKKSVEKAKQTYTSDKRAAANKLRAETLGIEKLKSFANKMNSQRWISTIDNFESTARGVVEHNKANGWDPDARVRVS